MLEFKANLTARVPVRLLDANGSPVVGVAYSAVTATVEKADGTTTTLSLTAPDWVEITTGAFSGQGKYDLIIPLTATNVTGVFSYAVSTLTAQYIGIMKIVASESVDLRRLMEGRWKVYNTGPDINRLVLYSSDGSTVLQKWDLKDANGAATLGPVFERVPTITIP